MTSSTAGHAAGRPPKITLRQIAAMRLTYTQLVALSAMQKRGNNYELFPLHNPTLRALERKGLAFVEMRKHAFGNFEIEHWAITDAGRVVAAAKAGAA